MASITSASASECSSCIRLKSSRDSFRQQAANIQRELLEEKIANEELQNELGDLKDELQKMGDLNVALRAELEALKVKVNTGGTDAVPVQRQETKEVGCQASHQIPKSGAVSVQVGCPASSASKSTVQGSSKKSSIQYIGDPPPRLTPRPESLSGLKSSPRPNLRPAPAHSRRNPLFDFVIDDGNFEDLTEFEAMEAELKHDLEMQMQKALDSDEDPEWVDSDSQKSERRKPVSKTRQITKRNVKRKAVDELDEKAATSKKLKSSEDSATGTTEPADNSTSIPSSSLSGTVPSGTSLRAHITSLLASAPPIPQHRVSSPLVSYLNAGPPVQIRRDTLRLAYGMSDQQMIVRIKPERNPVPINASRRQERKLIFPLLERNPLMPAKPGKPGVLFTARPEAQMRFERCSMFTKAQRDGALWGYLGEYKCYSKGKIGGRWYSELEEKVRSSLEADIIKKAQHAHYRERIARRLGKSVASLDKDDVRDALSSRYLFSSL
ncbi:hypothetical protein GYMLUDRAFT_334791 [Collybiopsis luxurians FD-317 M1]|nr:hypothetical protein GYMLUDRAFT_334791 [Collybiopsis luxurians FD-317 M1]